MPISTESAPFLGLWGVIQASAEERATTAELWAELRPAMAEQELASGTAAWQAVNEMRSVAVAQRNGWERFTRAALGRDWRTARLDPSRWADLHPGAADSVFTSDHAAPEINMRPVESREISPEYLVRYQAHFVDLEGAERSAWLTMRDTWPPGLTVAEVVDAVHAAAEAEISEPDGSLQGELIGVTQLRPVMI